VLAVLREALGHPGLGPDEDFFAAGGTSLRAVAATLELGDRFGVDVGVRDLVAHPTATGLRDLLASRGRARVPAATELMSADLAAPALLAGSSPHGPRDDVRTVLLTGATGFVGARLLHELLARTDLQVICLVRGRDDADARRRVSQPGRARVIAGDLARPGLGLAPARRRALAAECDLVLHAGALVNLVFDYRMHREPNVLGTAEILRFAREAGGIPVHHVSTLGVLHDHALATGSPVREDVDIATVTPPAGGYSASKWVAERLVDQARDLPVTVLRLGEVMPATDAGEPNRRSLTHLLLTAFRRLGAVPRAEIRSDYSPVDLVARAVVAAVVDRSAWGRAAHVYQPGSVPFADLAAGAELLSCNGFVRRLRVAAAAGDTELGTLLAVLEHRTGLPDDESAVRAGLENLLQDNPALFDRTVGADLDQRAGLGPVAAPTR
jgi:thioester reductase-like protein